MRSEMVLRWFAKDGREFDSERDCRGYEREKETERDEEVARYKRELLHCHNLMEFAEKFRNTSKRYDKNVRSCRAAAIGWKRCHSKNYSYNGKCFSAGSKRFISA